MKDNSADAHAAEVERLKSDVTRLKGRVESLHTANGNLRERITSEILTLPLLDNTKSRFLHSDGTYKAPSSKKTGPARRSQMEFISLAMGSKLKGTPKAKLTYPEMKLKPKPTATGKS